MKTIDIKGKDYVPVTERLIYFKKRYPDWRIITEIIKLDQQFVLMKASVIDSEGITRTTAHAYEKENSSFINKTSYIENCETSAVGRALGIMGIGIDTSLASADEVANAVKNQKKAVASKSKSNSKPKSIGKKRGFNLVDEIEAAGRSVEQCCRTFGVESLDKLTEQQAAQIEQILESYSRRKKDA